MRSTAKKKEMKQEHKHAQVLRWIADGENVEARCSVAVGWMEFPGDFNERATARFLAGESMHNEYEFRLKPKVVKIGDREVEAPVAYLEDGDEYWNIDSSGEAVTDTYTPKSLHDRSMLRDGRLFATKEAALAAHEAITSLLTGKES